MGRDEGLRTRGWAQRTVGGQSKSASAGPSLHPRPGTEEGKRGAGDQRLDFLLHMWGGG